ncbi:3,4-dihydroxy-2-butanone-4-phosphate synthase [Kiloniella laminariae]|uniref:3,4-dihydroxy-2-butanone-4-phosphate synthase n=1 Tax=Kiloniella laminariae TaxID=454162 RepID=UPI00068853FD|nr:3,4-dihydroxy-2-butanone-4-phosphate synthase [Kiloniella laminariae]
MNQIANDHTQTHQSLLAQFGTAYDRVEKALAVLRAGQGVLVVDDESRENEGDLIFPAETLTNEQMAMLIRECSGIVCLCMTDEKLQALDLPQMVSDNNSSMGTGFTVTIEAKVGVTTGVSAADRVTTVKTAIADDCKPDDLARPGHVFPLRAMPGGVLQREGHTEATCDLSRMAGWKPAGVLCEVTNPDGTMARLPEIIAFGKLHGFPVVSIEDIILYRRREESLAGNDKSAVARAIAV